MRTAAIRREFANLLQSLANNLVDDNPDITHFREYIAGIFGADITGLSHANSVKDVFDVLSMNWYWSYWDTTHLQRIVSDCSGQSKAHENTELLRQYKEKLAWYKAVTKIPHFMASIENGMAEIGGIHSMLSATVKVPQYHEKSLSFVDELWEAFCSYFEELKNCPQVLYKICSQSDDVMIIEWLINEQFFKKASIGFEKFNDDESHTGSGELFRHVTKSNYI